MSNLPHAAGIALVGWYLMAPPPNSKGDVRFDAPLSLWEVQMSFDSAAGCERGRSKFRRWSERDRQKLSAGLKAGQSQEKSQQETPQQALSLLRRLYLLTYQAPMCMCVASDDPRLKRK